MQARIAPRSGSLTNPEHRNVLIRPSSKSAGLLVDVMIITLASFFDIAGMKSVVIHSPDSYCSERQRFDSPWTLNENEQLSYRQSILISRSRVSSELELPINVSNGLLDGLNTLTIYP